MSEKRKQKQRKKDAKRRKAEDRRLQILDLMLSVYGVKSLFVPLDWMTRADLVAAIEPATLVAQAVERHLADQLGHRIGQLHLVAGAAVHAREVADHLGDHYVAADDREV